MEQNMRYWTLIQLSILIQTMKGNIEFNLREYLLPVNLKCKNLSISLKLLIQLMIEIITHNQLLHKIFNK